MSFFVILDFTIVRIIKKHVSYWKILNIFLNKSAQILLLLLPLKCVCMCERELCFKLWLHVPSVFLLLALPGVWAALSSGLLLFVSARGAAEMTGHANKLHHFCLSGWGQSSAICPDPTMNGAHFHGPLRPPATSPTPYPPKTPHPPHQPPSSSPEMSACHCSLLMINFCVQYVCLCMKNASLCVYLM